MQKKKEGENVSQVLLCKVYNRIKGTVCKRDLISRRRQRLIDAYVGAARKSTFGAEAPQSFLLFGPNDYQTISAPAILGVSLMILDRHNTRRL